MAYDPERHHRHSIRRHHHDYTGPGSYFVTICTHQRRHLFGDVVDGIMHTNASGRRADVCWHALPDHFPHVVLDAFKSAVTKHINRDCGTPGTLVWQRNYYEHIIRNEQTLNQIRRYIIRNPQRWPRDRNRLD